MSRLVHDIFLGFAAKCWMTRISDTGFKCSVSLGLRILLRILRWIHHSVKDSIINKLETPGLFSTSNFTIPSESVTALLIFFSISFGVSKIEMVAFLFGSDLLIFFNGSCKDFIRAPFLGIRISGIVNTFAVSAVEALC